MDSLSVPDSLNNSEETSSGTQIVDRMARNRNPSGSPSLLPEWEKRKKEKVLSSLWCQSGGQAVRDRGGRDHAQRPPHGLQERVADNGEAIAGPVLCYHPVSFPIHPCLPAGIQFYFSFLFRAWNRPTCRGVHPPDSGFSVTASYQWDPLFPRLVRSHEHLNVPRLCDQTAGMATGL